MRFSRVLLASVLGLLGCAVDVDAHARLVSPIPWNPNPSTQQVCGSPAAAAIPARYAVTQVNPNAPLVVSWVIVAADGRGPLNARIDTTAKTNPTLADFAVRLTTTPGTTNNPARTSATPYQISFQIPAGTVCTGPGGTCTLRVASTSNWVACATIRLGAGTGAGGGAVTTPTTPAPTRPPVATATRAPTPPISPATATPVDIYDPNEPINPLPTTPAPVLPPAVGSGGSGGPIGAYRIPATAVQSGLEFLISAAPPQVPNRPQGLLLFLHGSTASNYNRGLSMFAQVAQQYDMIRVSVLAPNGQGWNEGGAAAQQAAAARLDALINQDILPSYNIDTKKIFLTGQSSGGGFLSQYFVPTYAKNIAGGGAFFQCGAAAPATTPQVTAANRADFKLHFEITTGDTIWPASYARSVAAYQQTGLQFTQSNTKPGGHCAFDQQQVILDNIQKMLPQPVGGVATPPQTFSISSGDGTEGTEEFQVFAADPSTETKCVVATGLTACPKVNGQSVQLLTTTDLKMVDLTAQAAIAAGLASTDIMTTTPSLACREAFRDLICASHFIPCKATTAVTCQATCQKANQVCSFNSTLIDGQPGHDSMYDCGLPKYQQQYSDANGMCAGAPPAINDFNGATSFAQPMMIVTLLMSLIGMIFH